MTVIATSTAVTATAYSNQRKVDRCQNGVLWSMFWDGTSTTSASMEFRYSTDEGATWNAGTDFGFAGTGTTYTPNGSLFIDLDDFAHAVYKDRHNGFIYYRRGTPNAGRTAWTWSAAVGVSTASDRDNHPDIVVHREGTGWKAHVVVSNTNGSTFNFAVYYELSIDSGGTITVGARTGIGGDYAVGSHTWPSIEFNHTGDGKTVAGSTPHLYAAWSSGATGSGQGIRFKKATYSSGSWTWGTEREIDSTRYITNAAYFCNAMFDGTRVLMGGFVSGESLVLYERDAADTTTTTHVLESGLTNGQYYAYGSATYTEGAVYFLGNASTASPFKIKQHVWTRAGATSDITFPITPARYDTYLSAKRGFSNSHIEFIYTDGSASPHDVTYGSISLFTAATMKVRIGTAWESKPVKRYTGTEWAEVEASAFKRYDGAGWVGASS